MRKLFYVSTYDFSKIKFWQLKSGEFKIIENDQLLSIIQADSSYLVNEIIADVFSLVPDDQITLSKPVVTLQNVIDKRFDSYYELTINHEVTTDNLKTSFEKGQHVWKYNGHIIVSEDIKDHLLPVCYEVDSDKKIMIQEIYEFSKLVQSRPENYHNIWMHPPKGE